MAQNYLNTNMSGVSFSSHDSSVSAYNSHETNFEVSDFFEFNDWIHVEDNNNNTPPDFSSFQASGYNYPYHLDYVPNESGLVDSSSISNSSCFEGTIKGEGESSGEKKAEIRDKVAFRTKSEIEILTDGFKWRKYGKKKVKNSPNPRNYYKCSAEGCNVKKRVERDKDDRRYVVTTYEGIHNHEAPDI